MNMKMTFEAKMDGLDKVLEQINNLNKGFAQLGEVSAKSGQDITRVFGDLQKAITDINRTGGSGLDGLIRSFSEAGKAVNKFLSQSHIDTVKQYGNEIDKLKQKTDAVRQTFAMHEQSIKLAQANNDAEGEAQAQAKLSRAQSLHAALFTETQQQQMAAMMQTPIPGLSAIANRMGMPGLGTIAGLPSLMRGGASAAGMIAGGINLATRLPDLSQVRSHNVLMMERQLALGMMDPDTALMLQSGAGEYNNRQGIGNTLINYGQAGSAVLGRAAAGAAAGAIAGSFIPIVGTAIGAAVGGIAGGVYGYYATPDAREIAAQRDKDKLARDMEKMGAARSPARRAISEQGSAMELTESVFGVGDTFDIITGLAAQQGLTVQDIAGTSNAFARHGRVLAGNSQIYRYASRYRVADSYIEQMARRGQQDPNELFAMWGQAGIGQRASDVGGRTEMSRIVGESMSNLGVNHSAADVAAPISSLAANMGNISSSVERVQVAATAAGFMNQKMGDAGSIQGFEIRTALLRLGVPPGQIPVVLQYMNDRPKMVRIAAILSKKSIEEVQAQLGGAWDRSMEFVKGVTGLGALDDKQKQALRAEGTDVIGTAMGASDKQTSSGFFQEDVKGKDLFAQGVKPTGTETEPEVPKTQKIQEQEGIAKAVTTAMQVIMEESGDVGEKLAKVVADGFNQIAMETSKAYESVKADPNRKTGGQGVEGAPGARIKRSRGGGIPE